MGRKARLREKRKRQYKTKTNVGDPNHSSSSAKKPKK